MGCVKDWKDGKNVGLDGFRFGRMGWM